MKLDADTLRKLPLPLRIEIEENAQRKPLTQSELAAEQRTILAALRKYKTPGQRTDLNGGEVTCENTFSEVRATAIVGKLYGESHKQVEKRQAIVDAAEAEPERFGPLLADIDRSGRLNGPYRRLRNQQQADAIRAEPPPLPGNGPYRGAISDCPWAYEPDDDDAPHRGVLPYASMSIAQLCAMPVGEIMDTNSIMLMWVTNYVLAKGLHVPVLNAWGGLEPKTVVTWPKDRVGRGHWAKGQTEHLVLATRGAPTVTLGDHTTLLAGPFHLQRKNAHSEKPVEAYAYMESLVPAPRYLDLFSRFRFNEKWDCHGDQAPPPLRDSDSAGDGPRRIAVP